MGGDRMGPEDTTPWMRWIARMLVSDLRHDRVLSGVECFLPEDQVEDEYSVSKVGTRSLVWMVFRERRSDSQSRDILVLLE